MATLRYDISAVPAGWLVKCDGVSGSAYSERNQAVLDTLAIAERLQAEGLVVQVRLFNIDGVGEVLRPKDAKRFAR